MSSKRITSPSSKLSWGYSAPSKLAYINNRPSSLVYLEVRAHKIGMGMGLDNAGDVCIVQSGKIIVRLRVAGRINNNHPVAANNGVRSMRQSLIVKLMNYHIMCQCRKDIGLD